MLAFTADDFRRALAPHKRLLGLDVGERTIGLAMCDGGWSVASPLETLKKGKLLDDVTILLEVIEQHHIGGLVIGYPLNMDGSLGPRAQSVKQFARNLDRVLDMPLLLWDERMSTQAVNKAMLEGDLSRAKRKERVDKLAAAYILQGFLDSKPT
ncbi:MAG: Holliday junction resolvase RuvX [Rickettsiales bacterium]|nr:Holliday junction resolvase RuvX [Rickettsiales bacterium]